MLKRLNDFRWAVTTTGLFGSVDIFVAWPAMDFGLILLLLLWLNTTGLKTSSTPADLSLPMSSFILI